jgi:hypothetical protein
MLDDGSFNGVRKFIRADKHEADAVQIRYEGHDITPIIEQNKRLANEATGRMGDMERVASIPCSVLYQWLKEDGVWALNDPEYTKRKLNDPNYRYLKCRNIIL